jgi:hypothetical protein
MKHSHMLVAQVKPSFDAVALSKDALERRGLGEVARGDPGVVDDLQVESVMDVLSQRLSTARSVRERGEGEGEGDLKFQNKTDCPWSTCRSSSTLRSLILPRAERRLRKEGNRMATEKCGGDEGVVQTVGGWFGGSGERELFPHRT